MRTVTRRKGLVLASLGAAWAALMLLSALVPAAADGSRPPTPGEQGRIELGFVNAHKHDDGIGHSSIREVRVSVVDRHWASVIYKPARRQPGKRAKSVTEFFFEQRPAFYKLRRKAQVPPPVLQDLKQPAKPVLVDVRYRGSGSFTEEGTGINERNASATFNWDIEWRDFSLYDRHYPQFDATPDVAEGGGDWTYSNPKASPPCSASGTLTPDMHEVDADRVQGTEYSVDVFFPFPTFTSPFACSLSGSPDFWGDVVLDGVDRPDLLVIRDVPTFPTEPVEATRGGKDFEADTCHSPPSYGFTCTFDYSATLTVTPTG